MPLKEYTDQMGRTISISSSPRRIISLVPSQTELLVDLGLTEELVGITKFCIHPDEIFKTKTRVGGTKKVDLQKVRDLQPDLIIANKEENSEKDIRALEKEFPVWISDIKTLNHALSMIESLGSICNRKQIAGEMVRDIKVKFEALALHPEKRSVLYFIWQDPYMLAGEDTFIDDVIKQCGWTNAAAGMGRYPELNSSEISDLKPDVILLSSEPFPFSEKHIEAFKIMCPESKIELVDGEMFSWYGSRLLKSPAYLEVLARHV